MASHFMYPASALAPETRQILRILGRTSFAAQACRAIPSACVRQLPPRPPSQRRSYGARSTRPSGRVFRGSSLPSKGTEIVQMATPPAPEFSAEDIPPMTLWESVLDLAPEDLTLTDFDKTAKQYCAIATKGNSTWKGTLERDHGVDTYTLHYTALLLLAGPTGPFWQLGAHMLRTASDLDYAPSTLTLIRLVLQTTARGPEDPKYKTALHGPLSKFRLLVREGRNPDALTLDGALRLRRGDARGALDSFNRAIKVATTQGGDVFTPAPAKEELRRGSAVLRPPLRRPAWATESMCHVERGRLLLQQGDRAAAEAAFRVAAMELDTATGCLELGKMLPVGSPERETCLLRAGVSGKTDALPFLSGPSADKLPGPVLAGGDSAENQRWANEWRLLASRSEEEGETSGALGTAS